MNKTPALNYEGLHLPETLNYILDQDFWLLDNITGATLTMLRTPMKFTSSTSIFVRKGTCKCEINLRQYDIVAPCIVNIGASKIMEPILISEDFEGAFVVMSERFINNLFQLINEPEYIARFAQNPVLQISAQQLADFEMFYRHLHQIVSDTSNRHLFQTVLFTLAAFFFQTALKCLTPAGKVNSSGSYIATQFLRLAQENFKKERFLEFYANELQITPKHLSRTLKTQTGYTACEWLDRLIILEAKVLLKSSPLNIQQIAEELNFPSQSFFGKYFKKNVGVSPKEFRNS